MTQERVCSLGSQRRAGKRQEAEQGGLTCELTFPSLFSASRGLAHLISKSKAEGRAGLQLLVLFRTLGSAASQVAPGCKATPWQESTLR